MWRDERLYLTPGIRTRLMDHNHHGHSANSHSNPLHTLYGREKELMHLLARA